MKIREPRWSRWFASLAVLLAWVSSSCQVIKPGELHEERFPVFNTDSIEAKGISKITLRNTSKPSSRPIYDHGRRSVYEFDANGNLTHLLLVFPLRSGQLDTVERYWFYRSGKLASELEVTGSYQRRTRYEEGEDETTNRTIEVRHQSEEWQSVGNEVLQNIQRGNRRIFTIATQGNPPFEEHITSINNEGHPTLREVWNGPRLQAKERWSYDDSTITYSFFEANATIPARLITYEYADGLIAKGRWCKRAKCEDWSLYYDENGMPKAWLFIDPVSQDMEIWEFRYEYTP